MLGIIGRSENKSSTCSVHYIINIIINPSRPSAQVPNFLRFSPLKSTFLGSTHLLDMHDVVLRIGVIHKPRGQTFWVVLTPLPICGQFY